MKERVNIFWFRRDLRLHDNAGLYYALREGIPVLPIFIFDTNILGELEKKDARVQFIYQEITRISKELNALGSSIEVFHATPLETFMQLINRYEVAGVFTNNDYEGYAIDRDSSVKKMLQEKSISFQSFKDQVIFEKSEIVKDDGKPYTVFTPYSRRWKEKLNAFYLKRYTNENYFKNFLQQKPQPMPSLEELGFEKIEMEYPSREVSAEELKAYNNVRDFPALDATSRMGLHLRFGTISIRWLVAESKKYSETYVNELVWREFYQSILWHFPHVTKGQAFRKEFDNIKWRNNEKEFELWCSGQTGYPLVDAGMRQLNATGFMHNRVRMVTASFLAKHLLIDWRWGEAYFALKLLDYDFASNNGGWQWAAGSGCDAAPYFRIFNPTLQAKKFDPGSNYIRKWVPEFSDIGYPPPLVAHEFARGRCLREFGKAVKAL